MLTMSAERRYQQIRAGVQARHLAVTVAGVDWNELSPFISVDNFLTFLDAVVEPDAGQPGPHRAGVER